MLRNSLNGQSTDCPSVLVFDSGVGGLSVCQSILSCCPEVRILYVADNAVFPYGTKSENYLRKHIVSVLSQLCDDLKPEMMVIACNTASTLVLPSLRDRLSIPVVGVVPAIKPAANASKMGAIGLLATPATVTRPYTDQLIADFSPHCDVIRVGSSRLVEIAEEYFRGVEVNEAELSDITSVFFCESLSRPVDKIVLGCTHFPLLKQQLKKSALKQVEWMDSGNAIASRVRGLLDEAGFKYDAEINVPLPTHKIMFTGSKIYNEHFESRVLSLGFYNFEVVGSI